LGMAAAAGELDRHRRSRVGDRMKSQNDLSVWSIIERIQRRLERQGMSPAVADRALSLAIKQLATGRA
jgi:hypothetical protein